MLGDINVMKIKWIKILLIGMISYLVIIGGIKVIGYFYPDFFINLLIPHRDYTWETLPWRRIPDFTIKEE